MRQSLVQLVGIIMILTNEWQCRWSSVVARLGAHVALIQDFFVTNNVQFYNFTKKSRAIRFLFTIIIANTMAKRWF